MIFSGGGKSSTTGSRLGCFIDENGVVHSVDFAAIHRSLARDFAPWRRRFGPWMAKCKYGMKSYPSNGSGSGEEAKGPGGESG